VDDDFSRVAFDVSPEEWLYTAALAILAATLLGGLLLAGVALRDRRRANLAAAAVLVAFGAIGLWFAALATVDSGFIALSTNLYLSDLLVAATHATAVLVGVGAAALAVGASLLLGRRPSARSAQGSALLSSVPVLAPLLLAVALLALIDGLTDRFDRGGHPAGTDESALVGATRILVSVPFVTGLAPAPAGDLYFTELGGAALRVLPRAASGSPGPVETVAELPVPETGRTFDVLLHPEWPDEPYAYVTAQHLADGVPQLRVLRVRVEGRRAVEVVSVAEGLPTEPEGGTHVGAALATCGGYLFLSIGDTEDPASSAWGDDRRRRAPDPAAAEGKILRYRLDHAKPEPAGLIAADPPVYAMGFRNPFAMLCDDANGLPIVADNGESGRDVLRIVPPASNHEWPLSVDRDRLATPLWDSGLLPLGPTGLAQRDRPDGNGHELLLTTFHSNGLYAFDFEDGRVPAAPRLLYAPPSSALEVAVDAHGCVYVSDVTSVWRLDEPGC